MTIYLAGAVTANLSAHWRDNADGVLDTIMKIYFAGTRSRPWIYDYENLSGGTFPLVLLPRNNYGGGVSLTNQLRK